MIINPVQNYKQHQTRFGTKVGGPGFEHIMKKVEEQQKLEVDQYIKGLEKDGKDWYIHIGKPIDDNPPPAKEGVPPRISPRFYATASKASNAETASLKMACSDPENKSFSAYRRAQDSMPEFLKELIAGLKIPEVQKIETKKASLSSLFREWFKKITSL